MATIKRLNINKFTTESDNDAFIEELKQLWLSWSHPSASGNVTVDINKDRNDPTQMTAFVTASNDKAMKAVDEFAVNAVIPMRDKYEHENIKVDAELLISINK